MTIPEILAALERFGGTARPTEPGLLVLTLPAETTRERLNEVTDAVCAMGLPADMRVGVTRAAVDCEGRGEDDCHGPPMPRAPLSLPPRIAPHRAPLLYPFLKNPPPYTWNRT